MDIQPASILPQRKKATQRNLNLKQQAEKLLAPSVKALPEEREQISFPPRFNQPLKLRCQTWALNTFPDIQTVTQTLLPRTPAWLRMLEKFGLTKGGN